MDLQLQGRQALVTGGSAGIGLAIVRALAAESCAVAFCGRNQARVQSALQSCRGLPGKVTGRVLEVQDGQAFGQWLVELGRLDVVVLNVSALSADWTEALMLDVQATVACAEASIPWLLQSDAAAISYIGSKAGSLAAPNSAAYGAAKAAMAHFMKSLSSRLLPRVRGQHHLTRRHAVRGRPVGPRAARRSRSLCYSLGPQPHATSGRPE